MGERSSKGVSIYFLKLRPVRLLIRSLDFDLVFEVFLFGVCLIFLEELGSVKILL